jgi:SAM-dependent methyltransferase
MGLGTRPAYLLSHMPSFRVPYRKQMPLSDDPCPVLSADEKFDQVYPESIRQLSNCHWTPVEVARKAAQFLVTKPGTRVLDIGSGAGKFCAVGALTTEGHFIGIEQREHLALAARKMLLTRGITQVDILHRNVMGLDFDEFDAFYLFNPFQENMLPSFRIDSEVPLEPSLCDTYAAYVSKQLSMAKRGTRVVAYWSSFREIPPTYDRVASHFDGKLNFWVQERPDPMAIFAKMRAPRPHDTNSALAVRKLPPDRSQSMLRVVDALC